MLFPPVQNCRNNLSLSSLDVLMNCVTISFTLLSFSSKSPSKRRQLLTVVGVSSTLLKVKRLSKVLGWLDIHFSTSRVFNPFLNWSKATFLLERTSYIATLWIILPFVDSCKKKKVWRIFKKIMAITKFLHSIIDSIHRTGNIHFTFDVIIHGSS